LRPGASPPPVRMPIVPIILGPRQSIIADYQLAVGNLKGLA
jgi:hypothetical protein